MCHVNIFAQADNFHTFCYRYTYNHSDETGACLYVYG